MRFDSKVLHRNFKDGAPRRVPVVDDDVITGVLTIRAESSRSFTLESPLPARQQDNRPRRLCIVRPILPASKEHND